MRTKTNEPKRRVSGAPGKRAQRGTSTARRDAAGPGPVLLATKGSGDSSAAATAARLIARHFQSRVHAISVVEPAVQYGLAPDMLTGTIDLDSAALDAKATDVKRAMKLAMPEGQSWTSEVSLGYTSDSVAEAARTIGASLIVVGASPHRRMRRIIAGRRAAQILHKATIPVLSVAPWLHSLPENVVAAIDFNSPALFAARTALSIMQKGARMTLLHVIPPGFMYPSPSPTDELLVKSIETEVGKLKLKLQAHAAPGVAIDTKIVIGDPANEILLHAENMNADLVALGTSGGSAFRRALVGSVATEVFHSALCSVLASPPPSASQRLNLDLEMKGTAETADPDEFEAILHEFNARNKGRTISLEEDDPNIGAQVQVHGYVLAGVTFDKADQRVEIMLGASKSGSVHLTRTIPGTRSIAVLAEGGRDTALQISHDDAQTLVLLEKPAPGGKRAG